MRILKLRVPENCLRVIVYARKKCQILGFRRQREKSIWGLRNTVNYKKNFMRTLKYLEFFRLKTAHI